MCWWEAGQRRCHHPGVYLPLVASKTPPKKSSMEETAHQSIPQVLEQGLGTSDGSPRLGMCAASVGRQSIGLLWFITDKSGVVRFYLLI